MPGKLWFVSNGYTERIIRLEATIMWYPAPDEFHVVG